MFYSLLDQHILQFFSKEHINLLLSIYFFVLGTCSLSSLASDLLGYLLKPTPFRFSKYNLQLTKNSNEVLAMEFDTKDIFASIVCAMIGGWYVVKKVFISSLKINQLNNSLCSVSTGWPIICLALHFLSKQSKSST